MTLVLSFKLKYFSESPNNTDVVSNEEGYAGYAAAGNDLQHENRTLNTYQCILIS